MKFLQIISLMMLILTSCTAKKVSEFENGIIKFKGCPDGGNCNVKQIKNSQISLEEDGTGVLYPKIRKSNTHHLYKITYTKEADKTIADNEYQEVIYFEIEKSKTFRKLNNKALDRAKVIYGRSCRCPRMNGFEPVYKGSLDFETFRQITEIKIDIQPEKYPILMKDVSTTVSFYE